MSLEELIEKITDVKKLLNEFEEDLLDVSDNLIDDSDYTKIKNWKDEAYCPLCCIKDLLNELLNWENGVC